MSSSITIISPIIISSRPASVAHSIIKAQNNGAIFISSSKPPLINLFLGRNSYGVERKSITKATRPFSPVMQWQDCKVKVEVDVPCSVAYSFYSDREATPRWMPLISSVKVLKDKPDLSHWSLEHKVFGQKFEFSWLARNMQPIPNQKIHWRSLEGIPNKGSARFYPKGPSSCVIELNVSFEVPPILIPVASTLRPFLEGMLLCSLKSFAKVAKYRHANNRKDAMVIKTLQKRFLELKAKLKWN